MMTIPTSTDFEALDTHMREILFELIMAGRASYRSKITGVRWVVEQDKDPYWMISIYGLGTSSPMGLDAIALYLGERGYNIDNIEVILESDDDTV